MYHGTLSCERLGVHCSKHLPNIVSTLLLRDCPLLLSLLPPMLLASACCTSLCGTACEPPDMRLNSTCYSCHKPSGATQTAACQVITWHCQIHNSEKTHTLSLPVRLTQLLLNSFQHES